jgi:hypothetical protein
VFCILLAVGLYQQKNLKKLIMQVATMNADRAIGGYALANNEGEAFWLLGMLQTVKIGHADTNGGYGLIEVVVPPDSAPRGMCTPKRMNGFTCWKETSRSM